MTDSSSNARLPSPTGDLEECPHCQQMLSRRQIRRHLAGQNISVTIRASQIADKLLAPAKKAAKTGKKVAKQLADAIARSLPSSRNNSPRSNTSLFGSPMAIDTSSPQTRDIQPPSPLAASPSLAAQVCQSSPAPEMASPSLSAAAHLNTNNIPVNDFEEVIENWKARRPSVTIEDLGSDYTSTRSGRSDGSDSTEKSASSEDSLSIYSFDPYADAPEDNWLDGMEDDMDDEEFERLWAEHGECSVHSTILFSL